MKVKAGPIPRLTHRADVLFDVDKYQLFKKLRTACLCLHGKMDGKICPLCDGKGRMEYNELTETGVFYDPIGVEE